MGSVPATSANFKKILKKGSVAVIAGGIAEVGAVGGEGCTVRVGRPLTRMETLGLLDGGGAPRFPKHTH